MMHPDREALLAEVTGEPANAEIRQHLVGCAECRQTADNLRQQWDAFLQIHDGALKEMLPVPPKAWDDLRPRMVLVPVEMRPRTAILQWVAIAAAMLLAVLAGWQYLRQPPTV